jgi:hypothetical protein
MQLGVHTSSFPFTGFATQFFDYDHDGWLDLFTANGAVTIVEALRGSPYPFHQKNQLFHNEAAARFRDVSAEAGPAFALSEVSRGAAFGDIDNDGDVDVLVGNDAGRTRLLMINVGNRRHWLGLRLVGAQGRDMYGARVAVLRSSTGAQGAQSNVGGRANPATLWRRARADGSYASANDPRVLVGLGDSAEPPRVRVVWPGGRVEEFAGVAVDRYTTLKEGSATPGGKAK